MSDNPMVYGSLQAMLLARLFMKVVCTGAAGYATYLSFGIEKVVTNNKAMLTLLAPNAVLKAEGLLGVSKMLLFVLAGLGPKFFMLIVILVMKWHHPSKTNPNGRFQKHRPLLLTAIGAQLVLMSIIAAVMQTVFIGFGSYTIEGAGNLAPKELAARAGFSLSFAAHTELFQLITCTWALAVVSVLSFALDFTSFTLYKSAVALSTTQIITDPFYSSDYPNKDTESYV